MNTFSRCIFFKSTHLFTLTLLLVALSVGGCANRAQSGAGLGALGGGLIGSLSGPSKNRQENALIGAAAGTILGYAVGNELDKADQEQLQNTMVNTPPDQSASWKDERSGRRFTLLKNRDHDRHAHCRRVQIEWWEDGVLHSDIRRACRLHNGTIEVR
ncbi:MAG: YMGG-like glycine zipper-containing protein [Magnetococcus sp. DMHC-6]